MSGVAALALVRQVQSVAENAELLKEHNCIREVASFLECYLDHPDSRARLCAASALATLSANCTADEWRDLDLSRARRTLSKCQQAATAGDTDAEELWRQLAKALEQDSGSEQAVHVHRGEHTAAGGHGEVRIELCGAIGDETRAAVLKSVVSMAGVVSATFDNEQVLVVGTRSNAASADPAFLADICMHIEELLEKEQKVVVLADDENVDVCYLDDDDGGEPAYLDDSDDELQSCEDSIPYLDDDEEEGCDEGELAQWSFFGHAPWLSSRRLQEFEEDPSIVARLRKARQRLEKRKHEEKSRISRLFSVITPLRTRATELVSADKPGQD
eukprot:gnl/TRDRNA2_/TRDRNA2_49468_c0_seq1.p1 gnl/TRDRNA2_/TRDRNA2_49468_c0~~gnl/TRDRNA2_/TRDRNA2_49468_c0_seq1.p1  ORF type:complete len:342 (+),score=77.63 gnl/TRDRNA2_/TRDRNA2_49468_c0_seq1:37-1026(+)